MGGTGAKIPKENSMETLSVGVKGNKAKACGELG